MTYTVVTVQAGGQISAQPLTLRLYTVDAFKKDLTLFLNDLKASPLINEQLKKELAEWESTFFSQFSNALTTNQEREIAATEMCFLIQDIIFPAAVENDNNSSNKNTLLGFLSQLKAILGRILPPDTDLDSFIEIYLIEARASDEILESDGNLQMNIQRLYDHANKENEKLKMQYDSFLKEMKAIKMSNKDAASKTFGLLDALTNKVTAVAKEHLNEGHNVQTVNDRLQSTLEGNTKTLATLING